MKRFFVLGTVIGICGIVYACGGGTTNIDGGVDSGNGNDGTAGDSGNNDGGSGNDTGTGNDGSQGGDGGCAQFLGSCDAGCPSNSVCVRKSMGASNVSECYPLPSGGCGTQSTCQCIGACACGVGEQCFPQQPSGIYCQGPVSRAEYKTDIGYLDDAERASLADQALSTRLAEYRYKTEPEGTKRHLGFIIDDMPNQSPAVQADQTHVDLYGYTSMLLATVQEQQRQIDELKKQVDALTAARAAGR